MFVDRLQLIGLLYLATDSVPRGKPPRMRMLYSKAASRMPITKAEDHIVRLADHAGNALQ